MANAVNIGIKTEIFLMGSEQPNPSGSMEDHISLKIQPSKKLCQHNFNTGKQLLPALT